MKIWDFEGIWGYFLGIARAIRYRARTVCTFPPRLRAPAPLRRGHRGPVGRGVRSGRADSGRADSGRADSASLLDLQIRSALTSAFTQSPSQIILNHYKS